MNTALGHHGTHPSTLTRKSAPTPRPTAVLIRIRISFTYAGQQVIKQIWISPHFGVLSRYPSAADKPFPFIRPVVLPPHSAVKRPFEDFFSLRPPGRSP